MLFVGLIVCVCFAIGGVVLVGDALR